MVWAETGRVATANPVASEVTTKPRRVRSPWEIRLLESSFIGRSSPHLVTHRQSEDAQLKRSVIIVSAPARGEVLSSRLELEDRWMQNRVRDRNPAHARTKTLPRPRSRAGGGAIPLPR